MVINDTTKSRHDYIYRIYEQLCREQRDKDPLKASYLTVSYYAKVISSMAGINLSADYVQRVIRNKISGK